MTKVQTWTISGLGTVALVVGVLLATGAITFAQSPTPSTTPSASGGSFQSNEDPAHEANETPEQEAAEDAGMRPGGCAGGHVEIASAAASVLGISQDDLRTALDSGQTLAQVAQAHGMSTDDFKAALTTKITADLKAKLDAGQITQAQYDSITSNLSTKLDNIINSTHGLGFHGRGPGFGGTRFRSAPSSGTSSTNSGT